MVGKERVTRGETERERERSILTGEHLGTATPRQQNVNAAIRFLKPEAVSGDTDGFSVGVQFAASLLCIRGGGGGDVLQAKITCSLSSFTSNSKDLSTGFF